MLERKIEIIQTGNRFTMQLIEDGRCSVLFSDENGAAVGYAWWLNPTILDLARALRALKCSEAQIRQAYESLLPRRDTRLEFGLPRD
jgi:hypothetical protein